MRSEAEQLSLVHLEPGGTLLRDTTFVVVDLETTGGRAAGSPDAEPDAITEIGAVKVRGGAVLGEFATLVNPERGIPTQITRLTGITAAMVRDAPTIDTVLPMFVEFAGLHGSGDGPVLVAHNAGFDIGFLAAAAHRCGIGWSRPQVLCTVRLARRILSREEAPSVRLAELARLFAIATRPSHRALDDARATVEVLHALIDRVGNRGVRTYSDLRAYLPNVTPAQRRKRVLSRGLPHRPGVYLFRGPSDQVLYVGTATDLQRRVAQYFNAGERRGRISEMVSLATRLDHVECAHPLEAGVRELRLLAAHAPPYNRRSRFPRRWWWVVLSAEAFPRLSVTRAPRRQRAVGPFRSRADAAQTAGLLARFTGVRTCTARLGRNARHVCPDREVAPCPAPHGVTAAEYAPAVVRAAALIDGTDDGALRAAVRQVNTLAERTRYESAGRLRDHIATAIETLWRSQRSTALAAVSELVAAVPDGDGGRQFAVIRYGQLAAAACTARGVPPEPVVDAILAGAQVIVPTSEPLGGALVEETALILRWLAAPGARIVRTDRDDTAGTGTDDPGWTSPARSAGPWLGWAATARSAQLAAKQAAEHDSALLAEPHPSREQLFGRPAVDRFGGPLQRALPGGQPFGAAG